MVTAKEKDIPVLLQLNNVVKVTGQYENGTETGTIKEDEDDWDEDKINIADPKLSISKLADKTTGVTLIDGRYDGVKEPGWYDYGEEATFKLIVRNYGNVNAKNLKVIDTMMEDLKNAVELSSAAFVIPEDIKTEFGNEISVTVDEKGEVHIDKLASMDSVTFDFVVTLKKEDIPVLEKLQNIVKVTGYYQTPGNPDKPIPEDEDDEDEDKINIADPKLSISKLADKTTGVTLIDGRYDGVKEPGWYDYGEEVTFKLIVRNYGNVNAKNLKVVDTMMEDLKNAVELSGAAFVIPEDIKTELGNEISVTVDEKREVHIDKLTSMDSVTFDFVVTLKKEDIPVLEKLQNIVKVTGDYETPGNPDKPIPEDEDDEDEDKINIADPKISISKLADKTTGVTLVDGRYDGEKEPGMYYAGEQVTYKMIVRNYGNVMTKNLKVTDTMSDELKQAIIEADALFVIPEDIKTELGNDVVITKNSSTEVTIDKLAVGDSVIFDFVVTIKKEDIPVLEKLNNLVTVTGDYETPGNPDKPIPEDEDDKDEDNINIFHGFMEVIKVSSNNKKKLKGAEFTIYNSKDKKIGSLKTDEKGYAKSDLLYETEYYLKETKAPVGYELSNKKYKIKLKESGSVVKLEVKNDPKLTKKDVTPENKGKGAKTGDETLLLGHMTAVIVALCLVGSVLRYRRKKR